MSATRFTMDDMIAANEEWGANCGPGAIAAIMDMTLDEVRPHMGDFEQKHYTNPTLMWSALRSLGVDFHIIGNVCWPVYGLARIQWEGPWTLPGVNPRARYRYTHWVGAQRALRRRCLRACPPHGSRSQGQIQAQLHRARSRHPADTQADG